MFNNNNPKQLQGDFQDEMELYHNWVFGEKEFFQKVQFHTKNSVYAVFLI